MTSPFPSSFTSLLQPDILNVSINRSEIWDFYAGALGFLNIWGFISPEFLFPGIGDFRKSGDFNPEDWGFFKIWRYVGNFLGFFTPRIFLGWGFFFVECDIRVIISHKKAPSGLCLPKKFKPNPPSCFRGNQSCWNQICI